MIAQLLGTDLTVMDVLLIVAGGAVVLLTGRYIVAYLNTSERSDSRFSDALSQTAMWAGMVLGGLASAIGIGIVELADIIGIVTTFVGGHPFIASNLGAIGLGAGAISGLFQLTADQYVGIAMMIVGAVFILSEVTDDAA